jgi:hypothetical protein
VSDELDEMEFGKTKVEAAMAATRERGEFRDVPPLANLKQLRPRFKKIECLLDARRRALELTRLLYELARLSFGIEDASYEITGDRESPNIVGTIRLRQSRFTFGCLWNGTEATAEEVRSFAGTLQDGNGGLLISMSGFQQSALDEASTSKHLLLLMDDEEVRSVIRERQNFDEFLTRKQLFLDRNRLPFHRVLPARVI